MTIPIKVLDVKPKIPQTLQAIKDLSENIGLSGITKAVICSRE